MLGPLDGCNHLVFVCLINGWSVGQEEMLEAWLSESIESALQGICEDEEVKGKLMAEFQDVYGPWKIQWLTQTGCLTHIGNERRKNGEGNAELEHLEKAHAEAEAKGHLPGAL